MTAPPARVEVRHARPEDLDTVAGILAAAFDDDPVLNWFVRQDERHNEALRTLLGSGAERAQRESGDCYVTSDGLGAAVWRPPGVAWAPAGGREGVFAEICGSPERERRFAQFRELMEAHHPDEPPHFYLGILGVVPASQRGGIGSALVRAVLERCDREGIPAYLASTKERNLAFYNRHGFVAREPFVLPEGGPPVWPMWREPVS